MGNSIAVWSSKKSGRAWSDVMTDFYYQNRDRPLIDDDYVGDLEERSTRQRPTLTRRQAREAWRCEKDFYFFSSLMIESTSYRAYLVDDLRDGSAQERKVQRWREQIEADRLHRQQVMEQIEQRIAKDRESACQHGQAERRQTE